MIDNIQKLADTLAFLYGENISSLTLPKPSGSPNSDNDRRGCADTWLDELYDMADDNMDIDDDCGDYLIGVNLTIDGKPYHIVGLVTTAAAEGFFLGDGHTERSELVEEWLGMTALDEYNDDHPIQDIAKKLCEIIYKRI